MSCGKLWLISRLNTGSQNTVHVCSILCLSPFFLLCLFCFLFFSLFLIVFFSFFLYFFFLFFCPSVSLFIFPFFCFLFFSHFLFLSFFTSLHFCLWKPYWNAWYAKYWTLQSWSKCRTQCCKSFSWERKLILVLIILYGTDEHSLSNLIHTLHCMTGTMKQSRLPQGMCFASQYLWQQL